ncbi:MAG: hypothetical protein OEZ36_13120 [Spirochaetota bacterium]|nr:hypothetical protein [Spirochaetota bacterium]
MGQVWQLIKPYREGEGAGKDAFVDGVLSRMLYEDGSVESDLRALMRKSALLRKEGAVSHSLVKDKAQYKKKMDEVIGELADLNSFMEYVTAKIPDRQKELAVSIKDNKSYIATHLAH